MTGSIPERAPFPNVILPHPSRVARGSILLRCPQWNNRVRALYVNGTIVTIAGTGATSGNGGVGDGSPATSAHLYYPTDVAVDPAGDVLIADFYNSRLRRINATTGIISTVAGTGSSGTAGDNGPASSAQLHGVQGVAVDGSGNIYVADTVRSARVIALQPTTTARASQHIPLDAHSS
jgi:hypothetical protein